MRELEIQGQWGFSIGKRLRHQGDAVVALLGQLFEFGFSHREPPQLGAPFRLGRSFGQVLIN